VLVLNEFRVVTTWFVLKANSAEVAEGWMKKINVVQVCDVIAYLAGKETVETEKEDENARHREEREKKKEKPWRTWREIPFLFSRLFMVLNVFDLSP